MSKGQDRTVYKRGNGTWVNKRNDADRASSLHGTQYEAMASARKMLGNQGGGDMTVSGVNGQFRLKNTISPGNDPFPPRG